METDDLNFPLDEYYRILGLTTNGQEEVKDDNDLFPIHSSSNMTSHFISKSSSPTTFSSSSSLPERIFRQLMHIQPRPSGLCLPPFLQQVLTRQERDSSSLSDTNNEQQQQQEQQFTFVSLNDRLTSLSSSSLTSVSRTMNHASRSSSSSWMSYSTPSSSSNNFIQQQPMETTNHHDESQKKNTHRKYQQHWTCSAMEEQLHKVKSALIHVQKQIHRGEELYYQETDSYGNIFKGWDTLLDMKTGQQESNTNIHVNSLGSSLSSATTTTTGGLNNNNNKQMGNESNHNNTSFLLLGGESSTNAQSALKKIPNDLRWFSSSSATISMVDHGKIHGFGSDVVYFMDHNTINPTGGAIGSEFVSYSSSLSRSNSMTGTKINMTTLPGGSSSRGGGISTSSSSMVHPISRTSSAINCQSSMNAASSTTTTTSTLLPLSCTNNIMFTLPSQLLNHTPRYQISDTNEPPSNTAGTTFISIDGKYDRIFIQDKQQPPVVDPSQNLLTLEVQEIQVSLSKDDIDTATRIPISNVWINNHDREPEGGHSYGHDALVTTTMIPSSHHPIRDNTSTLVLEPIATVVDREECIKKHTSDCIMEEVMTSYESGNINTTSTSPNQNQSSSAERIHIVNVTTTTTELPSMSTIEIQSSKMKRKRKNDDTDSQQSTTPSSKKRIRRPVPLQPSDSSSHEEEIIQGSSYESSCVLLLDDESKQGKKPLPEESQKQNEAHMIPKDSKNINLEPTIQEEYSEEAISLKATEETKIEPEETTKDGIETIKERHNEVMNENDTVQEFKVEEEESTQHESLNSIQELESSKKRGRPARKSTPTSAAAVVADTAIPTEPEVYPTVAIETTEETSTQRRYPRRSMGTTIASTSPQPIPSTQSKRSRSK